VIIIGHKHRAIARRHAVTLSPGEQSFEAVTAVAAGNALVERLARGGGARPE